MKIFSLLVVVMIIALFGVLTGYIEMPAATIQQQSDDDGVKEPVSTGGCVLPSAPSVTVDTPDLYGGDAVTTKNIYREVGKSSFAEVAGAGTFNADVGEKFEIVYGIGDANTEDDAQPFGCKAEWKVPCQSHPEASAAELCPGGGVIDDALATDLVARAIDPEDNNVISTADPVDIDNGDVFSIRAEWQGAFEEDFGNRFCGHGNVMTIKYLTQNFTSWYATDLNGNRYPSIETPTLHAAEANYAAKSFEVPTLESNKIWEFYLVADASGSGKEPSGSDGNVTVSLYDSNWYIDNDVRPPVVRCGVEDEDGNEVGAAAADTLSIAIDA
jgi:hypothetical protein